MAQAIGKEKTKGMLKVVNCETIHEAWRKAKPLDDEGAARIEALAEEFEGLPRLRELDGYLLLDAGDDESILVFRDGRGTRREIIGQILSSLSRAAPASSQENADGDQDIEYEDRAYDNTEDHDDGFHADEEVEYADDTTMRRRR